MALEESLSIDLSEPYILGLKAKDIPAPPKPKMIPVPDVEKNIQEKERLTGKISGYTREDERKLAEKVAAFAGLQKQEEAKGKVILEEKLLEAQRKKAEALEMKELNDKRQELEAKMEKPFIPTEENAKDLAQLFSLVNVLGFAMGAGGKGHAQQALSAMNGMLEGHQKGRKDLYDKEKTIFEENLKTLKMRWDALLKDMEHAREVAVSDYDTGVQEAKLAFAKQGADFVSQYLDQYGMEKVFDYVKSSRDAATKAVDTESKLKEDVIIKNVEAENKFLHDAWTAKIKQNMTSAKANQQLLIAQNAINSIRGIASVLEPIMLLPAGSTAGILPNLQTKDGMFNYVRNYGGRSLTGSEAKAVQTLYAGVSRYLATIEASGRAMGLVGLSEKLEALKPLPGDKVGDIALKIADIRRIASEAGRAMVDSGLFPEQQGRAALEQIERVERLVPFTVTDVVQAQFGGKQTLGESSQAFVNRGGKRYNSEEEAELAAKNGQLKSGEKVIINGVSGTWE